MASKLVIVNGFKMVIMMLRGVSSKPIGCEHGCVGFLIG